MARRSNARHATPAALCTAAAGALLFGCSTADSFRANPTPGLVTMSQSQDVVDNQISYVNDTNLRQLNEDFGYFWLYDRPSRMMNRATPY